MILNNSLRFSDNRSVESAYIITLKGNSTSEQMAQRCMRSCDSVMMPSTLWQAFDGTGEEIIIPAHLENQHYWKWLKQCNNKYSNSQLAVFFSHLSLWAHCLTIDQPIVILEHDAIMTDRLLQHNYYNCIQYLGNKEYHERNIVPVGLPMHGSIYDGMWRFILRAHAYAIDPAVARNLFSTALREGITKTLDVFIRCDIFAIIQDGEYAYDSPGVSTIHEKEDYSEDE